MQRTLDGEIKGSSDAFSKTKIDQFYPGRATALVCRSSADFLPLDLGGPIFTDRSLTSDKDVVGFDVEVDIPLGVNVFESPADLDDDVVEFLKIKVMGSGQ